MYRIDLHTHSQASPDGSLKLTDYQTMLNHKLAIIAITDHDSIEFAQMVQQQLGERIIVGEEIMTSEGEIIGLFLKELVLPNLSALETAKAIDAQGGLVYVPHPFETVRHGLSLAVLDQLVEQIDIIEVHNGRAVFQNHGKQAKAWADKHHKAMAASSDAHGWYGWGRTYSGLATMPSRNTLVADLQATSVQLATGTVGWRGILYPKLNRLRKAKHK